MTLPVIPLNFVCQNVLFSLPSFLFIFTVKYYLITWLFHHLMVPGSCPINSQWRYWSKVFFLMPPHVHTNFRGPPSWLWRKCNRLLRLGRPWGAVTLSRWCKGWYIGRWGARRGIHSYIRWGSSPLLIFVQELVYVVCHSGVYNNFVFGMFPLFSPPPSFTVSSILTWTWHTHSLTHSLHVADPFLTS